MFIYGKEAMGISKDAALAEIYKIVFGLNGSTAEAKVNTITGIMLLLDSLSKRFADKEENNETT